MNIPRLHDWLAGNIKIPRLYLVGGTVRDLLLHSVPKDMDLVCRGSRQFAYALAAAKNAAIVPMEKNPDEPCYRVIDRNDRENFLDVAEMRGGTITDDLLLRDFTINAVAIEVKEDGLPGEIIDPLDGVEDVKRKIIRAANDRWAVSDPLRILRAVRISAALNFDIEKPTLTEMKARSRQLQGVAVERVMAELLLILGNPRCINSFMLMNELGILEALFPELAPMKGCAQNGYHHKDVWEHSLLVLENTEQILGRLSHYFGAMSGKIAEDLEAYNRLSLLKLAALLHDIGKPATAGRRTATGRITFHGHDEEGAKTVDKMAGRMKFPNRERDFLVLLVREHLHALHLFSGRTKDAPAIKWFRRMGDSSVPAIILSMADVLSSLGPESGEDYRREHIRLAIGGILDYYKSIKPKIESPPLITGDDLITLGIAPGPAIGRILALIRSAQDEGQISSREEAFQLARRLMEQDGESKDKNQFLP